MAIDLILVGLFAVYAISSGFANRRRASRGLEDYFLAGRTVPGWKGGLSMAATQFAADTPLLVTGLIAAGGVFLMWRLWIYGIAFLLMAFVFAALWRRSGVLTDAELTIVRYTGRGVTALRVLKALYYGTLINCVVMAMVLVAALRVAEVFLPWHEWLPPGMFGVVLSVVDALGLEFTESLTGVDAPVHAADQLITIGALFGFSARYSTTGGLRSVIAPDVLQLAVALVGSAAYAWVLLSMTGGPWALGESIQAAYGAAQTAEFYRLIPPGGEIAGGFLIIVSLQWFFQMNSDGTGYLAQRSMACRSERDATVAGVVFTWTQIVVRSLIWLCIGLSLLVVYPFAAGAVGEAGFAAAREFTFVEGVRDHLPPGLRGLMLTALLAALASTLDTHLNWGASYWANDVYGGWWCERVRRRMASNRSLVVVARLSNLMLVVIALAVMANLGSIREAWEISLLFGAGTGSVLVLRWIWERINLYSELGAMAVSLALAPILLVLPLPEWGRLAAMAAASTSAAVAAALLVPFSPTSHLIGFYRKIRPPGFWAKTAIAAGEEPRRARGRLQSGMLAVITGSASLFAALAGGIQVLLPAPGASPWVGLFWLAAAGALCPVWMRLAGLSGGGPPETPKSDG